MSQDPPKPKRIPNPNGRPPKIEGHALKQKWDEFKATNPNGTQKEFAKLIGLHVNRIRIILREHQADLDRKEIEDQTKELLIPPKQTPVSETQIASDLLVFWT